MSDSDPDPETTPGPSAGDPTGPIAVVRSRADRASEHVCEHLLELGTWESRDDETRSDAAGGGTYHRSSDTGVPIVVRSVDDLHLEVADPASHFDETPRVVVFASRHSGDTGPLLTCHFTGNFGPAEYGGADRSFAPAAPGVQRDLVAAFDAFAPSAYEVGVECTHHGPTAVSVPSIFAELGSDEAEWDDPEGARAVARAIHSLGTDAVTGAPTGAAVPGGGEATPADATPREADPAGRRDTRHLFGVGGGHYAPRFERVLRETEWGVGHVAARWQLGELGDPETHVATLERAMAASEASAVLVAEGGEAAGEALADHGHRVVSETWVREVDDRPLGLVDAVESAVCPVDEGLRFGDAAEAVVVGDESEGTADGTAEGGAAALDWARRFRVCELPTELLAAARRVDADHTRAAVFDHVVAVATAENGNRADSPAAFPADGVQSATDTDGPASGATSDSSSDDTRNPSPADTRDERPAAYDALVDELVALLRQAYERVERTDDTVRAERVAFDPALAREAGVPEGPAFGRLSNGESVEVDGRTVTPEEVRSRETETFEI